MSLRTTWPPEFPGEGLQAMNLVHCIHIVLVIGKYTDTFLGRKKVTWEDLSMKEFFMGEVNF